jgi:DNA polymerase-3 subunit epsilon
VNLDLSVMTAFDLETTGVDPERDRIVSGFVCLIQGADVRRTGWLANPGVPIPEAAAKVHGITTEKAQVLGLSPRSVLPDMTARLAADMAAGAPMVGMNLTFDLTMLDRECRRHGVPTLTDQLGEIAPVLDIRVIDKHFSWRKGGRKLEDLCRHYGVRHEGAHDACEDALAAARVMWKMVRAYPKLAAMNLDDLHEAQTKWAAEQAENFAEYLRRQGKPAGDVDGSWPIRPYPAGDQ